ncbi:MAG: Fe-S oxidoreductase [Gammaproteobacteria bacterium]|nr:Fe-S oxidoreductase [Gammaproteobacteria bacterium]
MTAETPREGSLEAPTRHPIAWTSEGFYDETELMAELERVFDICHGCRRCFNLCDAFPTLFDAVDESESGELDTVDKRVYWDVVDHCYLCDICYATKCPYVPPHAFNIDFPHLMLRGKAVKHAQGRTSLRDKLLTSTDLIGKLAGLPVIDRIVNAVNRAQPLRKLMKAVLGIHNNPILPEYHSRTFRKRFAKHERLETAPVSLGGTEGRVVLFSTCFCNYNEPQIGEDLVAVFEHNGIPVQIPEKQSCCGMPKLELGDMAAIKRARDANIPELVKWIDRGWDIVTPVPSCTLMFKQELPLMFPDDPDVKRVAEACFDPFEYLALRHKAGALKTDFSGEIGKVSYQVACHLRVQNIGLKTRDILALIPGSEIAVIERCSGHDGTYAVKAEFHESSLKIVKPVSLKVADAEPDSYVSDCPMAATQIKNGLRAAGAGCSEATEKSHPMTLLRRAYGL